jgi:methyl-accepting chemotaxis protein
MSAVLIDKKRIGDGKTGMKGRLPFGKKNGRSDFSRLSFIDILPVPMVFLDREFNIHFANRSMAEALGCSREDCTGRKCHDVFKFPLCNTPNCQAARVFADGRIYSSEVVLKSPAGECLYRSFTIPVKDDSGLIIGAIEYFIDASRELLFALDMGSVYNDIGQGKLESRMDYKKYDGVLRKAAKGTNLCLDGLLGLFRGHHEYFLKIGRGERNLERWADQKETSYGAWRESAIAFNEFIDSINNFMSEVDRLTRSASEGDLNARSDPGKFKGAWADIVGGINNVLDAIIKPVNEVTDVLYRLAGGDLTCRVEGDFKGDLIRLKDSTNKVVDNNRNMVVSLRDVARLLNESAQDLSKAAGQAEQATGQIAGATQQVAKGAAEQAHSMQDTLKALEQLAGAIDQIARGAQDQAKMIEKNVGMVNQVSGAINQVSVNAVQATDSSKAASETANNGAQMVQKTIKEMEEIKNTIDKASEKVSELGSRSKEIGKIVATINDIADQTNLLALNAAIEAARAGEQGRGFAVVADEVRKLAERSSASTKEIAELIGNIQAGVSQTIAAMEKGTGQIAGGYELATRAGVALEEILARSKDMGEKVARISAATQELAQASSEMVKLSDSISAVVEENTAATEEMAATARQVSKSIESVAGIAEQNSASTEQVSASAEEITAQIQQVAQMSKALLQAAEDFSRQVSHQKL